SSDLSKVSFVFQVKGKPVSKPPDSVACQVRSDSTGVQCVATAPAPPTSAAGAPGFVAVADVQVVTGTSKLSTSDLAAPADQFEYTASYAAADAAEATPPGTEEPAMATAIP